MIKSRGGNTPLPTIHRRGWSFNELGKLSEPAEIAYDLVAEALHGSEHAIIATLRQGGYCDIRDCVPEPRCVDGLMDIDQLKALMKEHGETQAGLARLLKITPDKLSKTLSGKRSLRLEEANILSAYFGLDKPKEAPVMLPIVGLVSAGAWAEGFENIMGYMPSPDKSLSRDSFVVIVEGDSMDLVAKPGEGIVVDPRECDLVSGRYYVVRNGEGETTFKQYKDNPSRLEPCSTNSEHKTIYPGREQFTVVGRARKRVSDL